jgi:hypothetical protein
LEQPEDIPRCLDSVYSAYMEFMRLATDWYNFETWMCVQYCTILDIDFEMLKYLRIGKSLVFLVTI